MKYSNKLTEIYTSIDDFYKKFNQSIQKYQLRAKTRQRNRKFKLSQSEVMTLLVLFHLGNFKNLKHFYLFYVKEHLSSEFPQLVSYNRFVELSQTVIFPLVVYLKTQSMGNCTGISFIDSTPLRVCHNRRIHSHKVFKGIAERGHCSIGWFFGFKLHLIINDKGELMDSMTSLTLFIAVHRLHFNARKIAPHRLQNPEKCPFFNQKQEIGEWIQLNTGNKPC